MQRIEWSPGVRAPTRRPVRRRGGRPILHVVAGRELPATRAGVLDHMAFSASGLKDVKDRLDANRVPYELRRLPGSGLWQLFCHDPSGATVELDFEATESA